MEDCDRITCLLENLPGPALQATLTVAPLPLGHLRSTAPQPVRQPWSVRARTPRTFDQVAAFTGMSFLSLPLHQLAPTLTKGKERPKEEADHPDWEVAV